MFCRGNFTLQGKLDNTSDTNFRAINNNWPVLAYALDLGNITKTSNTLVFGIGLTRDPVVSYRNTKTTQDLSHLWYSRWSNLGSAVSFLFYVTAFSLTSNKNIVPRLMTSSPLIPLHLLEPRHSTIIFRSMHLNLHPNFVCQPMPRQL